VWRGKKPIVLYSESYEKALKNVLPKLIEESERANLPSIGTRECPVWVKASFYCARGGREPDLDGLFVACGDLLEKSGIIENDRWIKSWDLSRAITSDGRNPRTEIVIRKYDG